MLHVDWIFSSTTLLELLQENPLEQVELSPFAGATHETWIYGGRTFTDYYIGLVVAAAVGVTTFDGRAKESEIVGVGGMKRDGM